MKEETFLNKLKEVDHWKMQKFWQKDYDGGCPCFSGERVINGKLIGFWGRCWRVSENDQDLYYWSQCGKRFTNEVLEIVKRKLDEQEWYNEYTPIKISIPTAVKYNVSKKLKETR